MKILDILLPSIDFAISLTLIVIFIRRRLARQFPLFFSYIAYGLIATVLRFSVSNRQVAYFWMYWGTDGLYDLLAMLTLREVFQRIFPPAGPTFRRLRWFLPATIVLLMAFSLYATFYANPPSLRLPWFIRGIYWFDIGISGVEGIFLPLTMALILVFGVAWPRYEIAILSGFAVSAYSSILSIVLRFMEGKSYDMLFRYGPPFGFIVALLIWLGAFIIPPSTSPQVAPFKTDTSDEQIQVSRPH